MKTMKMNLSIRKMVLLASLWLFAAAMAVCSGNARASGKFGEQEIETKVAGTAELVVGVDSPVYVEFAKSPVLTDRLGEMLKAGGLEVTSDKAVAKTTVLISGDLVMVGGPVYYKGVKLPIGDAAERALAAARDGDGTQVAAVVGGVSSLALNAAGYSQAISPGLRALHLSRMADVLGEASGIKGWFNTKVAGDPRGICVSRCEEWKKVKQAAYVTMTVTTQGVAHTIRVQALIQAEVIAPDEVITAALEKALLQIAVGEEGTKAVALVVR